MIGHFHHPSQPGAVGAQAAVVFNDDIDVIAVGVLAQRAQAICRVFHRFGPLAAAGRVDANGMAAHELRRLHPAMVILYRLGALIRFFGAQCTLAIDHDQQ